MGSGASTSNKTRPGTSSSNGGSDFNGKESPVPNYHKSQAPPPPSAPLTRKRQIFKEADYQHVDNHVLKTPSDANNGTFKSLITYLNSNEEWDDLARVRAIFRWVTSVDVFTMEFTEKPPRHSPMEYFLKIQNNMGNHAHLMAGLCQMAGIPCVILSGMNKSAAYEIGKKAERQSMGAQWNAVYVGGNWRFVDAFWASACVVGKKTGEWSLVDSDGEILDEADEDPAEGETQHRINEFYFFPDPDQIIWTHFPDEPIWQLLEKPVTEKQFEDHYYVRERFHILDMHTVEKTVVHCVAETKDGEVEFAFGLPPEKSASYRYKYMLYRSKAATSNDTIDVFLDRFVLFEQRDDLLRFHLRFPIQGNFKLDIYGLDINDGDVFDLCCTYILNCQKAKPNCLPLPDCPPLGWGPGAEAKAAGLTPLTHKEAEVESKDGYVQIRLGKERALAFHQLLKHSIIDEATLSKYSVTEIEGDEAVVYVRLPQKGEYALKLFAQGMEEEGAAPNVLNYLINCSNTEAGSKPFPNVTNGLLGRNEMMSDKFGVKALTHSNGILETTNGKLNIDFDAAADVELIAEVHTNDGIAAQKVTKTVTRKGNKWVFDMDMPINGEYSLNVFARKMGDKHQMHSVHTYLIKSSGREDPASHADDGEHRDTSIPTETVETSDAEVMIPVPPGCTRAVAAVHRRNGNDPPDPSRIEFFSADDMNLVNVKLNDYGEYMLNLYTIDEQGNLVDNVAKYQVNRKRPGELYKDNLHNIMQDMKMTRNPTMVMSPEGDKKRKGSEIDPSKHARQNLQKAIDLKDVRNLEEAIKKYINTGVDETDPMLVKARKQLEIFKAKEALMAATQKRDMAQLEKALAHAKSVNTNHELDLQIALATRLKEHLAKIEKLRHSVLSMDSKTLSEIKTYSKPPQGVHQCLMATLILLGYQLKEVKVWQKCQAIIGKTGKESIMRKISAFEASTVPLKQSQVAKKIIEPFNKDQMRDVSAGAATFYIWADGMIEEVESYGGAEQGDKLRLEKKN